jgi:hypothetical protein
LSVVIVIAFPIGFLAMLGSRSASPVGAGIDNSRLIRPSLHARRPMGESPRVGARPNVIVVTGASSGIGEATAKRLAREPGAALVLVGRREERLRALADSLGEDRASWVAVDLVAEDAPRCIREHVFERHGRLDLLVNNAGACWSAQFADGGYENVRRNMAINFDAHVRLTEALLPLLRESAPSAIVNVSSAAGRVARSGMGAYCASKFAPGDTSVRETHKWDRVPCSDASGHDRLACEPRSRRPADGRVERDARLLKDGV